MKKNILKRLLSLFLCAILSISAGMIVSAEEQYDDTELINAEDFDNSSEDLSNEDLSNKDLSNEDEHEMLDGFPDETEDIPTVILPDGPQDEEFNAYDETEYVDYLTDEVTEPHEIKDTVGSRPHLDEIALDVPVSVFNDPMDTQTPEVYGDISAAGINNDPNMAYYIPADLFDLALSDIADADDHWFFFDMANAAKLQIFFTQDPDGDYDVYLYKLEDDGMLYLYDYSESAGQTEDISCMAEAGRYYLLVTPYIPAQNPYDFMFSVSSIQDYDGNEINDDANFATPFTNSVSGTIDNVFDKDWYEFTVPSAGAKEISVSGAPAGNNYALFLYDGGLNELGSFYINGSAQRAIELEPDTYYIQIESISGLFTPDPYELKLADFVPPPRVLDSWGPVSMELEVGYFYNIPRILEFERGGGTLVFDFDVVPHGDWQKLFLMAEIKYDDWDDQYDFEPLMDWSFDREEHAQWTYELPDRQWHIQGSPLYSGGEIRFQLYLDGFEGDTMSVTGSIQSIK